VFITSVLTEADIESLRAEFNFLKESNRISYPEPISTELFFEIFYKRNQRHAGPPMPTPQLDLTCQEERLCKYNIS